MRGSNGLSPKAFAHILLSNPTSYILLLIVQQGGVSFLPSPSLGCVEIFGDLPFAVSCIHAPRESIVPLMASSEMLRCLVKLVVKTASWWPQLPPSRVHGQQCLLMMSPSSLHPLAHVSSRQSPRCSDGSTPCPGRT